MSATYKLSVEPLTHMPALSAHVPFITLVKGAAAYVNTPNELTIHHIVNTNNMYFMMINRIFVVIAINDKVICNNK